MVPFYGSTFRQFYASAKAVIVSTDSVCEKALLAGPFFALEIRQWDLSCIYVCFKHPYQLFQIAVQAGEGRIVELPQCIGQHSGKWAGHFPECLVARRRYAQLNHPFVIDRLGERDQLFLEQDLDEVAGSGLVDIHMGGNLTDAQAWTLLDEAQCPDLGTPQAGFFLYLLKVRSDCVEHHPKLAQRLNGAVAGVGGWRGGFHGHGEDECAQIIRRTVAAATVSGLLQPGFVRVPVSSTNRQTYKNHWGNCAVRSGQMQPPYQRLRV